MEISDLKVANRYYFSAYSVVRLVRITYVSAKHDTVRMKIIDLITGLPLQDIEFNEASLVMDYFHEICEPSHQLTVEVEYNFEGRGVYMRPGVDRDFAAHIKQLFASIMAPQRKAWIAEGVRRVKAEADFYNFPFGKAVAFRIKEEIPL